MKRNIGIITILVGVGLFFISIIFSTGYYGKSYSISKPFIESIPDRYIVLKEGREVSFMHYEGGIAIPLKYPLSLSIVLILVGTGVVLLSKKQ
ncbi:MAG: hypothetical protein SVN78_09820 [Deferribacterota bacterium]|nr:hypothetical protein [Deferribacterota bacterium]